MSLSDDERREKIIQLRQSLGATMREIDEQKSLIANGNSQIAAKRMALLPKWEYNEAKDLNLDQLDALGANGWELVSTASFTTGFGIGGNSSMTVHMRYTFKREIISEARESDEIKQWRQRVSGFNEALAKLEGHTSGIEQELSGL